MTDPLTNPGRHPEDRQIFGPRTRRLVVYSGPSGNLPWLGPGPHCQSLGQHHIAHVGIMLAKAPFEIVRFHQSGTFMLACFQGEGSVLVDGKWQRLRAGQACLLPPFVKNSLKCGDTHPWNFAWVRYLESPESRPITTSNSPVVGSFDSAPLKFAIEGIHAESSGSATAATLHHWAELIHHYVLRFAQPHREDDRLWSLWQRVEAKLAHPWTLAEMAAIAYVSEEHLRRLCRHELGRPPMRHLTFLRIQRAAHLLSTTHDKVESIARDVGFESPFSFSHTFKQWIGLRPSEYRSEPGPHGP